MIIPQIKRDEYKLLWIHGDIKDIAEFAHSTPPTVRKALRGGYCSMDLAGKISDFYKIREMDANEKLRIPQIA